MRRRSALFGIIALAAVGWLGATSASFAEGIILIDRQRVLSESEPALRLREAEQDRRVALRGELDKIQQALEAEEAEISELRGELDAEAFEARVRAFDAHVREARRRSQALGEGLQAEFERARQQLVAALSPVLAELLDSHQADVIIDVRSVLATRPNLDVTDEAIRRLNASTKTLFAPAPAEDE